jgi:hypothetical protein
VLETRVQRRIFGTYMEELTGKWRKLHAGNFLCCKVVLFMKYYLSDIIRDNEMGGILTLALMGDLRIADTICTKTLREKPTC